MGLNPNFPQNSVIQIPFPLEKKGCSMQCKDSFIISSGDHFYQVKSWEGYHIDLWISALYI